MTRSTSKGPPFDQLKTIQRLSKHRRGQGSIEYARHQLYVAHDRQTSASVLIKLTSKPGLVYQNNLLNEIASLSTINRELPDSPYFFPSSRGMDTCQRVVSI